MFMPPNTRIFTLTVGLMTGIVGSSGIAQDYAEDPYEYDLEVGVVGRKTFDPQGKFNIALQGGINPFNALATDLNAGGSLQYGFLSWFGLDLRGYYHFTRMTALALRAESLVPRVTRGDFFIDFITYEFLGHVLLTPIYGKHHLWGTSFVNYVFYVFLGGGLLGLDQVVIVANPNTSTPTFSGGVGLRLYLSSFFTAGLELRDLLYQDRSFNDPHWVSRFSVQLTVGISLPFFELPKRKI
jgi:outer membrane beta-barrel protein